MAGWLPSIGEWLAPGPPPARPLLGLPGLLPTGPAAVLVGSLGTHASTGSTHLLAQRRRKTRAEVHVCRWVVLWALQGRLVGFCNIGTLNRGFKGPIGFGFEGEPLPHVASTHSRSAFCTPLLSGRHFSLSVPSKGYQAPGPAGSPLWQARCAPKPKPRLVQGCPAPCWPPPAAEAATRACSGAAAPEPTAASGYCSSRQQ